MLSSISLRFSGTKSPLSESRSRVQSRDAAPVATVKAFDCTGIIGHERTQIPFTKREAGSPWNSRQYLST